MIAQSVALDEPDFAIVRSMALGGDATTLAMADYRLGEGFEVSSLGSYRLAVDLADRDGMLSSLAPGQSEHPLHPHYRDGLDAWLTGRSSALATSTLMVKESPNHLLLEPDS